MADGLSVVLIVTVRLTRTVCSIDLVVVLLERAAAAGGGHHAAHSPQSIIIGLARSDAPANFYRRRPRSRHTAMPSGRAGGRRLGGPPPANVDRSTLSAVRRPSNDEQATTTTAAPVTPAGRVERYEVALIAAARPVSLVSRGPLPYTSLLYRLSRKSAAVMRC